MTLSLGTKLGHYEIRSKLAAGGMGEVYFARDTKLDRKVAVDELLKLSQQRYVSPSFIAMVYVALGDKDQAFGWLEKANDVRDLNVVRLKVDPRFASLRSDPRYTDLVRRIGFP